MGRKPFLGRETFLLFLAVNFRWRGRNFEICLKMKIIFSATNYPLCADIKVDPYTDVPADSWMAPYACAAKEGNIVSGKTLYTPFYSVTRGDTAQLIYNTMAKLKLLD